LLKLPKKPGAIALCATGQKGRDAIARVFRAPMSRAIDMATFTFWLAILDFVLLGAVMVWILRGFHLEDTEGWW